MTVLPTGPAKDMIGRTDPSTERSGRWIRKWRQARQAKKLRERDLNPDFHFFFFFNNDWFGVISAAELRAIGAVGAAQWDTNATAITFLRFYFRNEASGVEEEIWILLITTS